MTVELLFREALGPQPGGSVELVFGAIGAPPDPPLVDPRPGALRASITASWGRAGAVAPAATAFVWGAASAGARGALRAAWASAGAVSQRVALRWASTAQAGSRTTMPWASTTNTSTALRAPWQATLAVQQRQRMPWASGGATSSRTSLGWAGARGTGAAVRMPWAGGRGLVARVAARMAGGVGTGAAARMPWGRGQLVESIGGPWVPPALVAPPAVPCYVPDPGGDVLLLLRESLPTTGGLAALLFACRRASLYVIPIRRIYMVTNTTTLTRVSDGEPIECFGFSLSLDRDSWAWGFSASVPARALPLLMPTTPGEPVELEASVNGLAFRLIARSISRERQFNDSGVRVEGVGHTAVLDSPYSAEQAFGATSALTSQQLLDQALPFGWTCDWQLTPWLVPGGLWSHLGTPASAARAIAAAGGGYVLPHPSAQSFKVLPQYPVAPWDWASVTPDLEVPAEVSIREAIEWIDRPAYNGVYVSGTAAGGVLRLVKRTGTAGDVLAPMVVDRLITHADAARQRGLPVLADTGSQAWVTLAMAVLPIGGVVLPGKFVRYVDGTTARLGLARGVRVDVTAGGDSSPTEVWQSIRLETHES